MPQNATSNETPIEKKLVQIRREGEERDTERRASRSGFPYVNLRRTPVSLEAVKLVPEAQAREAGVVALEIKPGKAALAARDPKSAATKKIVRDLEEKKYEVKLFMASPSSLEEAWRFYKFVAGELKEITGKVGIEQKQLEEFLGRLKSFQAVRDALQKFDFSKTSVTALLEIVLAGALANGASDIHFEAEEEHAKIRFRLDGILQDAFGNLPAHNYEGLVSRIKLLSGLKINIRGEPQDGRFTIDLQKKEIEVRVSIIPSEFGETIVMRILDPETIQIDLSGLGIREDDLAIVERELLKPNGLILNTGPTGSGKTTTLYAFLRRIVSSEIKIITIEDPIEYRIEGVEQTQVDPDVGYSFAGGLRAILRQDPDAILVGEIRDKETADIAMQASLTGHLVFSTLHTNDAIGAVPRLIDLGVKAATVGPALSLVIAQRLVRKLCRECRKAAAGETELGRKIENFIKKLPRRVRRDAYKKTAVYAAGGCVKCNGSGYKGRLGIFEFLVAGPELEAVILEEASEVALRRLAEKQEMVTMQEDGILKVLQGETSFDEVEKITGPISW